MKTVIYTLLFITITQSVLAQNWKSDPQHSRLGFKITHMNISEVNGIFKEFEIIVNAKKTDFSDAVIQLTADIGSIDTEVGARDNHLKSQDFFDEENYPSMKFKSTSIREIGKHKYEVTGDLTLRNITKQVRVVMTYNGTIVNPVTHKKTAGFHFTGEIKRYDFNIGSTIPDKLVGNEVAIIIDTELQFNQKSL